MTTFATAATKLDIAPIAGYLGAEISGINLREPLDEATVAELRGALLEHKVLFFRDQPLDHAAQIAFTRYFGRITNSHPYNYDPESPYKEILEVDSRKYAARAGTKKYSYANFWHSDISALVNPPAITFLRSELVPEVGGDTTWTDLGAAYANLPNSLKSFVGGLRAEHRFGGRQPRWASGSRSEQHVTTEPYVTEHPVVRVHPETGQRGLFVTPGFTSRIVGLSPRQSDRILDLLFEEITNPAYTVRIRWENDSIGVWDNRITAHQAPTDLDHLDVVRVLHRTTVEGDIPVGVDGQPSVSVVGEPFYGND
ncbi:TauD/TfdA family dioxygenase [Rhodococcus rhodochrous]|uniref:TauD/TfdA dioxygenase family protein n=1 Tax=Rhodococcus rhodochrous TaxID=1829 RepID=UPI001E2BE604|nr:TauD/TfdA family dioxygenase [Rhodococcus rhodochrous]MCB8913765.1 TauD/TfdA family dioxygenase [Rhodococcus rhodochrous]